MSFSRIPLSSFFKYCIMDCPPGKDEAVKDLFHDYEQAFKNPGSLADFVANSMTDDAPYIAVFLPGGHGAMLGLPENSDLGELLRWAHRRDMFTLVICHGPAALLAAGDQGPPKNVQLDFQIEGWLDIQF